MPIKLNGSTSGYVQIDATAIAGTTQITLPAITGGSFIVSDSSGNVAIGTSSPVAKFNVKTTDGTNTAMFAGTTIGARYSTDSAGIYIDGTDPTGGVSYQPLLVGGSTWGVRISGTTKMTLDSSGNLQVGGTTVANTTGYVNSRTNTRAWVRWVGSSGAVTASYNVSSVTRNSTGNYTVNFTTSLADANYAPIGMTAGAAAYGSFGVYMQQTSAPTAASCAVTTLSNSGTAVDCIANQLVIFGN